MTCSMPPLMQDTVVPPEALLPPEIVNQTRNKSGSAPKTSYTNELLYRMTIVVLRHPESNHQGMAFWKYAERVYGPDFFDYRGHHGLREKWKWVLKYVHTRFSPPIRDSTATMSTSTNADWKRCWTRCGWNSYRRWWKCSSWSRSATTSRRNLVPEHSIMTSPCASAGSVWARTVIPPRRNLGTGTPDAVRSQIGEKATCWSRS